MLCVGAINDPELLVPVALEVVPLVSAAVVLVSVEPVDVELLSAGAVDVVLLPVDVELLSVGVVELTVLVDVEPDPVEVLPVELFCMQADCVEEPFDEVPAAVPLLVGVELVPVEEVVPVVLRAQ